jgi:hypothetical protein
MAGLMIAHAATDINSQASAAKYKSWKHSGSIFLLTTPDGAELPATASEENFPVLVRLDKDGFAFGEAQANGEDIRFSTSVGVPLNYQIDSWDATAGKALVWVRVPTIKGNARQEIKLFWGKADASSESDGKAVFNESNGYLSVWHMNDPVKDEVGTLESKDLGTTASIGMIGAARHFPGGKGIHCGEAIPNFPSGASPHSTEVWYRTDSVNEDIVCWGKEGGSAGKVRMQMQAPAHIYIDSDGGSFHAKSVLPKSEWVQVVHTYNGQTGQVYVNGQLDVAEPTRTTMNILVPARLWLGGWYNGYNFVGDMDEVRISKVARSADWVKLQYENQKPLQTLVGTLVQPGSAFAVSATQLTVPEGKSVRLTAQAGGALKVYWTLKSEGQETRVATDCFAFTFDAGRVSGDKRLTLQFKAVYATGVKTKEIPISVKEDIPEPVFILKAPAAWDGRAEIAVVPQVANLAAMQAKGAGQITTVWAVEGIAAIKEPLPGKLLLKRAQNSGALMVTATVSNGGKAAVQTVRIAVQEPAKDAWVPRVPDKDEKPMDGQFYARDDKNEGALYYNGTLSTPDDSVFLKLYADNKLVRTESQRPARSGAGVTAPSSVVGGQGYTPAAGTYAFTMKLKSGLIKYKVEFGTKAGGQEKVLQTVDNIVCGDAYIIDGQSNALATDTGEQSPPDTSEWIRSYGRPEGNAKEVPPGNLWCYPVWKAQKGEKAELGWWGMDLAKRLLASQKVPIFILTAAVGGTRIDQHQRNEADPTDLTTIYGRMLWRIQQAKLTHGIRGILWHQGENDQGTAGPSGGYGWESYQQYFIDMSAAWKQDFPNVQHYYIFQIWPNSCSMGNGHGDMLREKQRTLPQLYSNMGIMSTHGIRPPGPCHFPLVGWSEFARLIQPLMERDFYGKLPTASITPANLRSAFYSSLAKTTITLEFDQPIVWSDNLAGQFYLDDEKDKVASGSVSGNVLTLKLKAASTAKKITYLKEMSWSQETLLNGANGIAAFTFCNVPLEKTDKINK